MLLVKFLRPAGGASGRRLLPLLHELVLPALLLPAAAIGTV